jgi:hypothetical protein
MFMYIAGLGVITRDGDLLVVNKEHVRSFGDTDQGLPPKVTQALLELIRWGR